MIFSKRTRINVPVERLFKWHAEKGAIERMTPPWVPMQMISRNRPGIEKGVRVTFRLHIFKIPFIWESEHIEHVENKIFKDRQVKGPFKIWEHSHIFSSDGTRSAYIEDRVKFKLPFGFLGALFNRYALKQFERMFSYRHRVLKHQLENLPQFSRKMRILISGAGGTIGRALIPLLESSGHKVIRLVRHKDRLKDSELFWDPYAGILDIERAGQIDAVINLNGVDISQGRWSGERKKVIIDSRVIPTKLLVDKMAGLSNKPEVFISSSAIGYYGEKEKKLVSESDTEGGLFISRVCSQWEKAALEAEKSGIRTVLLRTGIVLTPQGGALKKMMLPFSLGAGVFLSHGRQYMSWISMDDEISAILFALAKKEISGPLNLSSPEPVTNRDFSISLAGLFSKKVFFTLPGFMVKLIWGQMGKETVLASVNVSPEKLIRNGFVFQHKKIIKALEHLLGR